METNMSLFNQVNSLCYWFQRETDYQCSFALDAEKDTYFVRLKGRATQIYAQQIIEFSKKSKMTTKLLQIELSSIAHSLVHIKKNYVLENQHV